MDQKYSFTVEGSDQKAEELKLDSAQKLAVGDRVSFKDGKKAKVKSVVLNVATGAYDVVCESVEPVAAPVAAEGNDPNPQRHAVKDVRLDPRYSPDAAPVVAAAPPAKKVAEKPEASVATTTSSAPVVPHRSR